MLEQQNPFHPDKIYLHANRLRTLSEGNLVAPVTLEMDLTDHACNQRCIYCNYDSGLGTQLVEIAPQLAIKTLQEARQLGTEAVEFVGGGEPLNHRNALMIIRAALDMGLEVGLITNGVHADKILELADKLKYIRVSLDSANETTYNFLHGVENGRHDYQTVLDNIMKLRQAIPKIKEGEAPRLGIGYLVIPPFNNSENDILAGAEFANALGVDYIVYRPAKLKYPVDQSQWIAAEESIAKAQKLGRGKYTSIYSSNTKSWATCYDRTDINGPCTSRPLVAVIQANGNVPHCILHRKSEELVLGNVATAGFASLWFGAENIQRFQNFDRRTCPTPCKHNSYTDAVNLVSRNIIPTVNPNQIAHHNHI